MTTVQRFYEYHTSKNGQIAKIRYVDLAAKIEAFCKRHTDTQFAEIEFHMTVGVENQSAPFEKRKETFLERFADCKLVRVRENSY